MKGRAIPGAYLFRLYVCDKEMSWPQVQSTLDRFLTSSLAKRQRPAAEEEETYLE
jgi:hypothetical protein